MEEHGNLLTQDFTTETINEKWVVDITYIYTLRDGWYYLESVLDLHTDLDSQYTSEVFGERLKKNEMIPSFSRKGCPYDNECIESFYATLKKENVYLTGYDSFETARVALFK